MRSLTSGMHLLNEFTGVVHMVEHKHIGENEGPLLAGKRYYVTKCHWSDTATLWGRYQLGKETDKPVTCKNCLRRQNGKNRNKGRLLGK